MASAAAVPVLLKAVSSLVPIDVLIPTCGRKTGLAVVLLGQTSADFNAVISDQTLDNKAYLESTEIRTLIAALRWRGHRVETHRHLPRRGMTEQRAFLFPGAGLTMSTISTTTCCWSQTRWRGCLR